MIVREEFRNLELPFEPLDRDLVARDFGVQHFERNASRGLYVEGLVDATHPSVGDDATHLVSSAERSAHPPIAGVRRDGHLIDLEQANPIG